jgi:hypothetical protein
MEKGMSDETLAKLAIAVSVVGAALSLLALWLTHA